VPPKPPSDLPTNPIGILLREPWIEKFSSIEKVMAKLLPLGFTYFELPQKHYFSEGEITFLRELKKKRNISYTIHSSSPCGLINLTNPNYVNFEVRLEQLFEFARRLGAELINFDLDSCYKDELVWERQPDLCLKRTYQTLVSRVNLLLNYSREYGIAVALENADVRDPKRFNIIRLGMVAEDFLKILRDCPDIRLTLDTGHLYLAARWFGFDLFKDFLVPLAPFIIHTHFSSNFGRDDGTGFKDYHKGIGDLHLPLQEGTLPWGEIVDFLLQQNYPGAFLLEIKPENNRKTLSEILRAVEVSFNLLKERIAAFVST